MIIQKIKATCTLTAAALFVSTIPINGLMLSADAAVIASGKCGSNLTWSVDDEANLTISGTGAMYDYYVSEMPWNGETFYNVIIENGVTSIGDYAFCNQYTVTNVSIPSTVTNIGTHAFSDCDDLNSIVIPDGVKTIERSAFSSCDDLSFVYIGKSVASIGDAVFSGSNMGVYIYIRSTDCTISTHEDTFSGVNMIYGISGSTAEDRAEALGIEFRIMDLTVPEGYMYVTGLCGDNLRWKADSEGLLEISGTGAMYDYTYEGGSPWRSLGITALQLNEGMTSIGEYAFMHTDITEVSIPESAVSIGAGAFRECRSLVTAHTGKNVIFIDSMAFYSDYAMESITIEHPVCEIYDAKYTIQAPVIYGYTGSTAETYAAAYERTFISLDVPATTTSVTTTTATTESTTTTEKTTAASTTSTTSSTSITTTTTTTTASTTTTSATTTSTTTTTKSDGSIEWGVDNWNFLNSRTYFPHKNYYMKQSYLDVLRKNLTNTEWYYVQDWMSSSWGGSCYGMSSLTLLSNAGYLTYSDWTKGAQCLNDLETPAQNEDIESLINYYQQLQIKNAIQQQYRTVPYRGNQTNIEDIISHLEKGAPVLLGFQKSGWGGHAIVAYDVGYGSWTWNGVTYQGKIDILDPNCSMEYDERYCIYFNTSSYNWAIPAYNGMTSASGAVFNYVGNDLSVINSGGYISGSANNNTESFIARMEASEIAENHSVQKVQRNGNSFNNMNAGPDDIVPDTFYVAGGESDGVFGYVLKDSESGYSVSQSNPVPMKLRMDYEECVLEAYSAAGSGITFDKSGYASVKGESASYEIQMVFNEGNYVTDWYAIEISGANADEIIFEQTEYGYVLVGNNLQDVNVSAWNDEHDADVTFSSEYTQVLIHEIDEDTIGISADTDGDGTYETIIAESEEDNTVTGDVNGDGTVNISDATLVLTLYASDAAGIVIDGVTEEQRLAADINGDGSVTISDATAILTYYSETAAGLDPSWEDIIGA